MEEDAQGPVDSSERGRNSALGDVPSGEAVQEKRWPKGMTFDGNFTAFLMLSKFLEEFLEAEGVRIPQYNKAGADAVHRHAKLIAKELIDGPYVVPE